MTAAREVPRLMQEFTRGSLTEYTPCRFTDGEDLAWALGVVYADFLRILRFTTATRAAPGFSSR